MLMESECMPLLVSFLSVCYWVALLIETPRPDFWRCTITSPACFF